MTHILANEFKMMSQENKERYENKYNLPNEIMNVFSGRLVMMMMMSWIHFVPKIGKGLTQAGMVRINESIRTYIYCVLGSQVLTRTRVIGDVLLQTMREEPTSGVIDLSKSSKLFSLFPKFIVISE